MTTQTTVPQDLDHARAVRRKLNIATIVVTFGALAFGYDTGVISGALPFMTRSVAEGGLDLNPFTEGLVTASLLAGAAIGSLAGGRLSDAHGRRRNVMWLAIIFCFGALGCALAPNLEFMIPARIVLGLAVGGASATVPMFIGELAPAHLRGPLVSRNELMIVTGQLIAYVSNAIIGSVSEGGHAWRLMLGLATIPAVALWVGVHFVPESPRWLVAKGRTQEALEVLRQLRVEDPSPEVGEIAYLVKRLESLRIPWIKLDATDMGRPLYARLGFEDECGIERWGRQPAPCTGPELPPVTELPLALDREATGADRSEMLSVLAPIESASLGSDAFAMGRPGSRAAYFGPCVSRDSGAARELLRWFLARHAAEIVYWDLLPDNTAAVALAREFGFEPLRRLIRMARPGISNPPPFIHNDCHVFAIAGFEYG